MEDIMLACVGAVIALFCMNLSERYGKLEAIVVWLVLVLVSAFVYTVLTKGMPQ